MRNRKKECNASVKVYTAEGKYIGRWANITMAAEANGVNHVSIYKWLATETHYGCKRFWIGKDDSIDEAMQRKRESDERIAKDRSERARINRERNERNRQFFEDTERNGDYIFIASGLCGSQCCTKCSIAAHGEACLPCRKDEGHENGYWRYSKRME